MTATITANQGVQAVVFGSLTANVTVSIATGNAGFVCFSAPSGSSPFSLTDNVGNTWTATSGGPFTDAANGWSMNCFWVPSSVGNVTTITIHETGSGNNGVFSYCEITGANTGSFVDQQLGGAGSAPANWNNEQVTPVSSNDLIITVVSKSSSQTLTINGGFTSLQTFTTSRTQDLGYIQGAGTSTYGPSWSGGSGGGTAFTIAIKSSLPPAATLIQKATSGSTVAVTNFTVQLTGVAAGNFLTLQASFVTPASGANNVSFAKPTDTNGTWQFATTFSGTNQGSGSAVAAVAFSRNVSSGTHTVTVSNAQGFSLVGHATLSEWSNLPANASVDTLAVSNATTAQTNTVGPTSVTGNAQDLVLAAVTQFPGAGAANIAITDPPTGFTSQYVQNATNAGDIGVEHSYLVTTSAGTQSAQWTWTDASTVLSQAVIAAFTPSGTQVQIFYRLPQHFVDESLILT